MDADKIIDTVNKVSNIADEAYTDIIQPPAQNIGKSLGTVTDLLNTVLTPIELVNKAISLNKNKFLKEYEKNLNDIPAEKIAPPNFSLIGPMIDHLKYKITEDELRQKYAKLISETSNSDSLVKPLLSFDNVLEQLSPYEVGLLGLLFSKNPEQNYPLASIKVQGKKGFTYPFKDIPNIEFKELPDNVISVMISNFGRLGIVNIDHSQRLESADKRYAYLTDSILYKSMYIECKKARERANLTYPECSVEGHMFYLTEFGKSFMATVIC